MIRILLNVILFGGVFSQTIFSSAEDNLTTEYTSTTIEKITILLPKCCSHGFAVGASNCSVSNVTFQPNFNVHKHNKTAFDDEPIDSNLITFETYIKDPCRGLKFPLSPEENPIFLVNGSLLLGGMGEYDGILGHNQFCIDNLNLIPGDSTVYTFVCVRDLEDDMLPRWVFSAYITLVTITSLLFTSSALFFYKQDSRGIHKRSFIAFAISMSVTYFIIILMQFISWGCKFFGLLLQFFVTISFCWLAVLCFDLAWSIHNYRVKENVDRTKYYLGSTISLSSIFLLISLTNNFTPDIPFTFFKPQFERTSCVEFANQRSSLFFTAIILTLTVSVLSLCYSLIKMNRNRYSNTEEGLQQWKRVSKKYSYMYGRKLVVFVSMIIWIFDAFSDRFPSNSSISMIILSVQAFHGFIVVPLYTMKTLRRIIDVNNKPRIDNLDELLEIGNNHINDIDRRRK